MKDLRIGVIGVGGRGTLAVLFNNEEFGSRVVAGADPNAAHLASFRKRNPDVVFTTAAFRALVARKDLAAISR